MLKKYFLVFIVFFFAKVVSFAQTPLYGLGDPLINVNFEAGSTAFGPEFPGYNNYGYVAGVPSPGFYTRVNNTNVAPNIWWPTKDYGSGDGDNGYMLVAKPRTNSSFEEMFRANVFGLCAGTTYQASAYLLNLSKTPGGIAPEITLRIVEAPTPTTTGATIAELNLEPMAQLTQDPTTADWVHPLLPFTAPAGVANVRLLIICRTPGGTTVDDIAIDDITVNATGQHITGKFDNGNPVAKTACAASPGKFPVNATLPDAGNDIKWQVKFNNGLWDDIENSGSATYTITSSSTPGLYSYRAASAPPDKLKYFSCSVVSNEITILVKPGITVSAGPQKFRLRGGAPVVLEGSSNAASLKWTAISGDDVSSLSNTDIATPLASPNQTTTYRLTGKSDGINNCSADVFDEVTVLVADEVDVPNTFTPNSDGINDRWVIGGIESYLNPIVQVYNRNGQLVYRSVGAASPWDGTYKGKNAPAGSYYYIVDLGINGLKLSGAVTVIR